METKGNKLLENFNEQNINEIRHILEKERNNGPQITKAYTLVQANSPCDVKISKSSRDICARAILK